jgi:hypothetical protein
MKNTKTCPKCGSNDIVAVTGQVSGYGTGIAVGVCWKFGGIIEITRYFCCACGFSEEWIEDPRDLKKIKKRYGKDAAI